MLIFLKKNSVAIGLVICLAVTIFLYIKRSSRSPEVVSAEMNNEKVKMHPDLGEELLDLKGESCEQTLANIAKLDNYLRVRYSDSQHAFISGDADIERVYANKRVWKVHEAVCEGELSYGKLRRDLKTRIQRLRGSLLASDLNVTMKRKGKGVVEVEGMSLDELLSSPVKSLAEVSAMPDYDRERIGLCSVLFLVMLDEQSGSFKDALAQAVDLQKEVRQKKRLDMTISNRFLLETWMVRKVGLKSWTEDTPVPELLNGVVSLKGVKPIMKWDTRFSSFDPQWAPGGHFKLNPAEALFDLPLFKWNENVSDSQLDKLVGQLAE